MIIHYVLRFAICTHIFDIDTMLAMIRFADGEADDGCEWHDTAGERDGGAAGAQAQDGALQAGKEPQDGGQWEERQAAGAGEDDGQVEG